MGEHLNPLASVKRVNASKHMQYESVIHNLGKKMFYRAPPVLYEDPKPPQAKGVQKKVRQTEVLGPDAAGGKQIDLPVAMKYRLSKTQPKRVEVGPSKIHRNGLFTHEDLAAGDIVIEYVGERIRNKVADKREIVYEH